MNKSGLRTAAWVTSLTVATMVVCGVLAVVFVARNIKVTKVRRAGGNDVSIQVPGGQFNIRAHENLDPATLGMPIYPNARYAKQGGGASFEWTSSDGKGDKAMSVAGGDYVTADSASTVLAWYKGQLPNWVVVTDRGGNNARFELTAGGYKRIVALREKSDGTHIGVATVGKPASN
jgi:hypothetical protein